MFAAWSAAKMALPSGTARVEDRAVLSDRPAVRRVGKVHAVSIYAFFAVTIIVAVYRYSMRLSAHYDACADALELSDGTVDTRFHHLVRSLSPTSIDFGKVPRSPVDQAAEVLQTALRSSRRT